MSACVCGFGLVIIEQVDGITMSCANGWLNLDLFVRLD